MTETYSLEVEAKNENLATLIDWIQTFCTNHKPATELEFKIQLIAEELFLYLTKQNVNDQARENIVNFSLIPETNGASLKLDTEGSDFNPLEATETEDLTAKTDDNQIDVLGLLMIRELTTKAEYNRKNNRNHFLFSFSEFTTLKSEIKDDVNDNIVDTKDIDSQKEPLVFPERCRPRVITLRICVILLLMLSAGVATIGALNFIKFERILMNATAERYDPILREVQRTINESLRGGLTLSSTRTTEGVLDRSVADFDDAITLVVKDLEGEVLFRTGDLPDAQTTVPPFGKIVGDITTGEEFSRSMAIIQDGTPVGTLSLLHNKNVASAGIIKIKEQLEFVSWASLLLFLPLLIIVTTFMVGRIEGRFYYGVLTVEKICRSLRNTSVSSEVWRIQKSLEIFRGIQSWTREMTGSRPFLLISLLTTLAMPFLFLGFLSVRVLEPKLLHEFKTQTQNASENITRKIEYAVSSFGGLHTLRDAEHVLDRTRLSSPALSFLALTNQSGEILHLSADNPLKVPQQIASLSATVEQPVMGWLDQYVQEISGVSLRNSNSFSSESEGELLISEFPILGTDSKPIGTLYAGVDLSTTAEIKRDIWIDIGVVVLAVILISVELLLLLFSLYLIRPAAAINFLSFRLHNRDLRFTLKTMGSGAAKRIIKSLDQIIRQSIETTRSTTGLKMPGPEGPLSVRISSLSYVRLPLFLFCLSEAILRPILPQFLGNFAPAGNDPNFLTGIVMSGFMAASLFSVLFGSFLSERIGARRIFLIGAVSSALGMCGHLFAAEFASIFFSRILTGFGYGLVYAAAQVHVAQHSDPIKRTTGFSLFLAVIVAAEICGPAIGGIIADRFGNLPVFMAATILVIFSGVICFFLLSRFAPDVTDISAIPFENGSKFEELSEHAGGGLLQQFKIAKSIMLNRRFSVAIICFAIPAKALLTGGLFLLIPLIVYLNGGGASESARVLMGYGIAILLLVSTFAHLADRWKKFSLWVATGSILAGIGFVVPHSWILLGDGGLLFLFAATLLFGIGQMLAIPTQISFLLQTTERQLIMHGVGPILGLFRFLERFGSFLGPVIASLLLLIFPPAIALQWMGFGTIILASIGMSWFLAVGQNEEEDEINALIIET
ncbi:MAG: MFS transporter [Aestuariivita sp.]|nr:MFS transporter [Aestuariivita sp.]